jgi:hypothetical protein
VRARIERWKRPQQAEHSSALRRCRPLRKIGRGCMEESPCRTSEVLAVRRTVDRTRRLGRLYIDSARSSSSSKCSSRRGAALGICVCFCFCRRILEGIPVAKTGITDFTWLAVWAHYHARRQSGLFLVCRFWHCGSVRGNDEAQRECYISSRRDASGGVIVSAPGFRAQKLAPDGLTTRHTLIIQLHVPKSGVIFYDHKRYIDQDAFLSKYSFMLPSVALPLPFHPLLDRATPY